MFIRKCYYNVYKLKVLCMENATSWSRKNSHFLDLIIVIYTAKCCESSHNFALFFAELSQNVAGRVVICENIIHICNGIKIVIEAV